MGTQFYPTTNERQRFAVINKYLHAYCCRWPIWRRLVEMAVEKQAVWVTETLDSREALSDYLKGRYLNVMTPAEFAKSVNRPKIVFCPVRPATLRQLDALLDADELHIIRSEDHAQKRFLEEIGHRITTRGSSCKTITYRDGR